MKLIVTHFSPDLDAVTSVWLIKRFFKNWEKAEVKFVAAGKTLENQPVDTDENVIHVDTGLGKFDHHDGDEDTCAARLVLNEIRHLRHPEFISGFVSKKKRMLNQVQHDDLNEMALERLVMVVNEIDHFREVYWPNPEADFYDFGMIGMLDGWKVMFGNEPEKIIELSLPCLDGIYKQLQNKVWAEKLLLEDGIEFKTKWGKAVGIETGNDEVIHTGQKKGFQIVVRKDVRKGYIRIKSLPDPQIDLSDLFLKLKKADPEATWYLHPGKHMILNGTTKNPEMRPTKLTLKEIIDLIKQ